MKISSTVFQNGGPIPSRYTCDGANLNPPLTVEGVPLNVVSLVLIVDDPDAPHGDWVHWLVWNIAPNTTEIRENVVPIGAVQGQTDFGKREWGGPCPPSGRHRYYFKLYALDTQLELSTSSQKVQLLSSMEGHIVDEASFMGTYQRQ